MQTFTTIKYKQGIYALAALLIGAAIVFAGLSLVFSNNVHAQTTTVSSEPMISSVMASSTSDGTGATITWMTDESANSQVAYGTSSAYTSYSSLNPAAVTNHSVALSGLLPSTTYHFQVISTDGVNNTNSTPDQLFITASPSTSTSTAATSTDTSTATTTVDVTALQLQLNQLQQQINSIQQQIWALLGQTGTTTTSTGTGMITPATATVNAGSSIDFNGSHFGKEESVTVTSAGMTIATAHADGGGNFSTGSLPVPMTAGSKIYTFTGVHSGITGTASLQIQ